MRSAALAFTAEKGQELQLASRPGVDLWMVLHCFRPLAGFLVGVQRSLADVYTNDDVWTAVEEVKPDFEVLMSRVMRRRARGTQAHSARGERKRKSRSATPEADVNRLWDKLWYVTERVGEIKGGPKGAGTSLSSLPPFVLRLGAYMDALPVLVMMVTASIPGLVSERARKLSVAAAHQAMDELLAYAGGVGVKLPHVPGITVPVEMDVEAKLNEWRRIEQLRARTG